MKICETCDTKLDSNRKRFCDACRVERIRKRDRERMRRKYADPKVWGPLYLKQIESSRQKQVWLCEYLSSHPCVDCGEQDITVLEFDHTGTEPKVANVSRLVDGTHALATVQQEVAKCEVRCANCHKRMTDRRNPYGTYRLKYLAGSL